MSCIVSPTTVVEGSYARACMICRQSTIKSLFRIAGKK
jgi:hypothetical protein